MINVRKRIALNTIFGIGYRLFYIVISLALNKIFLEKLGLEYLGLNATFNEIIGILSFAELGIGVAISYELYQPLTEKKYKYVNQLLDLYKRIYYVIAGVIVCIGTILAFLVARVAKTDLEFEKVYFYFMIFVVNNAASYFGGSNRTLIEANQDSYILNIWDSIIQGIFTTFKCITLFLTSNYLLFLIVTLIQTICTVLCTYFIVNEKYDWIKKPDEKLEFDQVWKLFKTIIARIIIKFSNIAVTSTDNLLISILINVSTVGLFHNYKVITNNVLIVCSQFFAALTPALGAKLTDSRLSDEQNFSYVKQSEFVSSFLSVLCGVLIITLSKPFISIVYGSQYVIPDHTVILAVISLYIDVNREIHWKVNHIRAGYTKIRLEMYVVRAILNLIASVMLSWIYGLDGIIMGTVISGVIIWWYEAQLMYEGVFSKNQMDYVKEQIMQAIVFTLITTLALLASQKITTDDYIGQLIINSIISLFCFCMVFGTFYLQKIKVFLHKLK